MLLLLARAHSRACPNRMELQNMNLLPHFSALARQLLGSPLKFNPPKLTSRFLSLLSFESFGRLFGSPISLDRKKILPPNACDFSPRFLPWPCGRAKSRNQDRAIGSSESQFL